MTHNKTEWGVGVGSGGGCFYGDDITLEKCLQPELCCFEWCQRIWSDIQNPTHIRNSH